MAKITRYADGSPKQNTDESIWARGGSNVKLPGSEMGGGDDGWVSVSDTWAYASATTITVPSGAASIYQKGHKFSVVANSVTLYGYIVGVADTVLTVLGNALTNHTFTVPRYSPTENPLGFPNTFQWTPGYTGFSVPPTVVAADTYFYIRGNIIYVTYSQSALGTSDQTFFTITGLPIAVVTARQYITMGVGVDNAATFVNPARVDAATTILSLHKSFAGATWTASGSKGINYLSFSYVY